MCCSKSRRPGVYLLRLNRPDARNALSPDLRAELRDHFISLSSNPECHAIVITGDAKAFAAGAEHPLDGSRYSCRDDGA